MNRIIVAFATMLVLTAALAIGLRGQVQQKTVSQVEGLPLVSEMATIGPASYQYGFLENFTDASGWVLVHTESVGGILHVVNQTLIVQSVFLGSASFQAFQVLRNVGVNLTSYPTLTVHLMTNVSSLGFGLRFQGYDDANNSVTVQTGTSSLEHQRTTGQLQAIQVDLKSYALSIGVDLRYLTKVVFYVEATAGFSGEVTLQISGLSLSRVMPIPYQFPQLGDFQYVLIGLNNAPTNLLLDRVDVSYNIEGSRDLLYTPELIQSANGSVSYPYWFSQGLTYVAKSISSYEVAVVSMSNAIPLDNLPYPVTTSILIALHALRGTIFSFNLKDVSLFYSNEPTVSNVPIPLNSVLSSLAFYMLFVSVIPVLIFLLIHQLFYVEPNVAKKVVYSAAIVGFLLRLSIAPFTGGFDLGQWIYYARVYFESGTVNLRYYPVLPPVYLIFLLGMSPYNFLRFLGLVDVQFFVHPNNMLEALFAKLPMLAADLGIFLMLFRLFSAKHSGKTLVYASAFLFNPFSIYISAAWGQTDALMLLALMIGIWFLEMGRNVSSAASLAFSGLIKIFGFYALALVGLSQILKRQFRTAVMTIGVSFGITVLMTLPLANFNNLVASLFLRFLGASGASVSQTNLLEVLVPAIPQSYGILMIVLPISLAVIYYLFSKSPHKLLQCLILIGLSIYFFGLGSGPQWLLWTIPLMILLGERDQREGMVYLAFTLGVTSFLVISTHLQGLGLLITGEPYWVTPLELLPNGRMIFALVSLTLFAMSLAYMFLPRRFLRNGIGVLSVSASIIACVYALVVISIA